MPVREEQKNAVRVEILVYIGNSAGALQ